MSIKETKIYIVESCEGEREDTHSMIEKAFRRKEDAEAFARQLDDHEGREVMMKVMQTSTTYSQHSLQETLFLYTNHSHYFLYGQSFVSSSHKRPNELRSQSHNKAKGYTHVRDLHHFSNSRASALL